jgi:hypothetical protein
LTTAKSGSILRLCHRRYHHGYALAEGMERGVVVYGFVGVAVGGDIVGKAVGRGEVVVGGVGLMGGELADSISEDRQV